MIKINKTKNNKNKKLRTQEKQQKIIKKANIKLKI